MLPQYGATLSQRSGNVLSLGSSSLLNFGKSYVLDFHSGPTENVTVFLFGLVSKLFSS